jgi:RNA polymerase sigma-70 factor (ECF subfamily)
MSDLDDHDLAEPVEVFEQQRPRLLGVAYRILGSLADAEDVVQEAWLRWSRTDVAGVESAEAYLTTVTSRLAVDRLRRVSRQREVYPGSWLPEPISVDPGPEHAVELADSLSMALLVVLETLSPLERAAFVLREVFGEAYPEVAAILGRTEPAVRQLVHRARERVDAGHARFQADRATHGQVVRRFLDACERSDRTELMAVLAPDVVIVSDGGGLAQAPRRPVNGSDKVARLLVAFVQRAPADIEITLESINGQLGLVGRVDGQPVSAMAVTVDAGQVQALHLIANPEKLTPLRIGGRVEIR